MRSNGLYRAALRSAETWARLLPELMPRRSAVVRANLALAFGRSRERLVHATFRHFASAAIDTLFFERLVDANRPERHFERSGDGWEHYRTVRPHGAVLVTGHFGNWELFGIALGLFGIPIAPVARPLDQSWLARRVERFRRAHGQEIIPKENALPLALKALRRGKNVAFLLDQAAGRHGALVPFFGRPVSTYTAPAALALKLGVPLYAGYSTRLGDGIRYRCHAERILIRGDELAVTRRLNDVLEGYVRACPEQWWWFHRRFKPRRLERAGRPVTPAGVPVE